jgi:putative SOS response-associated peptidase YedK
VDGFDPLRDGFNVAPTHEAALVRERDGERSMPAVQWGYVPGWAKDFKRLMALPVRVSPSAGDDNPVSRQLPLPHKLAADSLYL